MCFSAVRLVLKQSRFRTRSGERRAEQAEGEGATIVPLDAIRPSDIFLLLFDRYVLTRRWRDRLDIVFSPAS